MTIAQRTSFVRVGRTAKNEKIPTVRSAGTRALAAELCFFCTFVGHFLLLLACPPAKRYPRCQMIDALFQPFPMVAGRRAQVWRHQPQYRRPRHFHEEPEINLVVRGRAVMGIGDQTQSVTAGDVLLFHPGQDHVLLEASDDLDLFVMALRPELAGRGAPRVGTASSSFRIGSGVAELADELQSLGDVTDAASHELRLAELFEKLQPPPAPSHVLTRRALWSIVEEPGLSGASLARRLRTTPSSISRQFHGDLAITLVEHRARMRVMQFVRAVERGSDFTTAALLAHFGSHAQFHRVFRRTFGCSPRQYFAGGRELLNEATFMNLEQIRRSFARPLA